MFNRILYKINNVYRNLINSMDFYKTNLDFEQNSIQNQQLYGNRLYLIVVYENYGCCIEFNTKSILVYKSTTFTAYIHIIEFAQISIQHPICVWIPIKFKDEQISKASKPEHPSGQHGDCSALSGLWVCQGARGLVDEDGCRRP